MTTGRIKIGKSEILFDIEDQDVINSYRWYIVKDHNKEYAYTNEKRTTRKMHRLIMNSPKDMHIDHINGNGLDNRKCNLRIVSSMENNWNRECPTSLYFDPQKNKYRCRITVGKRQVFLGHHEDEQEGLKILNVCWEMRRNLIGKDINQELLRECEKAMKEEYRKFKVKK